MHIMLCSVSMLAALSSAHSAEGASNSTLSAEDSDAGAGIGDIVVTTRHLTENAQKVPATRAAIIARHQPCRTVGVDIFVKPQKIDAYEIGIKSRWLGGHLELNAYLFEADDDNYQTNFVNTTVSPTVICPMSASCAPAAQKSTLARHRSTA